MSLLALLLSRPASVSWHYHPLFTLSAASIPLPSMLLTPLPVMPAVPCLFFSCPLVPSLSPSQLQDAMTAIHAMWGAPALIVVVLALLWQEVCNEPSLSLSD